jgi:hypothetical protein
MTQASEYTHDIRDVECAKSVYCGLPNDSFEGTIQIQVRFSESAGGQMGGQWHRTSRRINILYGNGNENHELGTGFLYIKKSYQQLRRLSLLVIGCHT